MKKALAILFVIVSVATLQAQTQDNAMYVYRNDGGFNAFLREDIDSITLSHFDLDSIEHQTPVCQVFFTPDSIYRIPVEVIDSVSFVQPETKYATGVILLDEQYLPYIVDATDNTITFSHSTPSELLPKKGNVLAAMVFEEALSEGFAGRIDNENRTDKGIQFECSDVSIEDIYDQFVYTGKAIAADETAMAKAQEVKRRSPEVKTFYIETIHASTGPVSVDAHPTITVYYTINRNKNLKTHQSLIVKANIDIDVSLEASVEVGDDKPHIVWLPGTIRIPTEVPGLYGTIRGGAFYKATAAASVTATCPGHIYWKFGFTNGDDGLRFVWNYNSNIKRPELSVNMNGELDAGLCARIGFGIISDDVASIYLTGYAGLYANADFILTDAGLWDGTLYSSLKDSQLEVGAYICGEPGYIVMEQGFRWRKEEEKDINLSLEYRFPFHTWYLLPDFTEPQIEFGQGERAITATCHPSRDVIMPVSLGLGVEDETGKTIDTKWCDENYWRENDWTSNALRQQFDGLYAGKSYTVTPYLKILGYEMKASPAANAELDGKVTTGDATDITEESATLYGTASSAFDFGQSVVSAGFCIGKQQEIDINNSTVIRTKADENFSATTSGLEDNTIYYYRAFVTVGTKVYYGDIRSFQTECSGVCPDYYHPHSIDLGLPSGTRWSCCNVGAESPDEDGAFYAWAETTPKQAYTWSNNQDSPYDEDGSWKGCNIMRDISHTEHDVATMVLGGTWRMPTKDEMQELLDYCDWVWNEDRKGYDVTGPNGNFIFLPAAGNADGSSVNQIGAYGGYWTSTPNDSESKATSSNLYFYKASLKSIQYSNRYVGRSIRPVTSPNGETAHAQHTTN